MRRLLLILTSVTVAAATVPSFAQTYLNGAPPGGLGTYSAGPYGNTNDPRWRDNNWRDGSADNWRENNWREDRGTWRRNNWREDRADDWRQRNWREETAKDELKTDKKVIDNDVVDDNEDCRLAKSRPDRIPNPACK